MPYDDNELMALYDDRHDGDYEDYNTFEENQIALDNEGQDYDDGDMMDADGDYEAIFSEDSHLDMEWEDRLSGGGIFGEDGSEF